MNYELTVARTPEDLAEVADLVAKVFARRSYFDLRRTREDYQSKDPYFRPEFSRIVRVDGRIVSHVSLYRKPLRLGSATVQVGGIGDVCTHPDHRGKGYTNILMNDALASMAANRFPMSMLYGIMNFYHKFGYIEAANAYTTYVPPKNLARVEATAAATTAAKSGAAGAKAVATANARAVRPFEEADRKSIYSLYDKTFAGKTLSAVREPRSWYAMLSPKTCFVAADAKNRPTGYVVVSEPPAPPSLGFHVREAAAFEVETASALAAFLRDRALAMHLAELEVRQRPDSYFVEYLAAFGGVQTAKIYYEGEGQAMLRIVLLRELFEDLRDALSRRLAASSTAPRAIEVFFKTDAGNAGLRAEGDEIVVTAAPSKGATVVATPQNALTRLVLGHAGVGWFLGRIGQERLAAAPRALLETLFPVGNPHLGELDYF